jgi:hypothetical protein
MANVKSILDTLKTLPQREALETFWSLTDGCLRDEIVSRLTTESKERVNAATNNGGNRPIWHRIFKDHSWLESAVQSGCHPVLIGAHLDGTTDPWIILFAYDISGDLMYSFESSLNGHRKLGTREYVFGSLQVTVCGLYSDSEVIEDCTELFTSQKDGSKITTRYCSWEDSLRGVRSVEPKDIIGIDGKIIRMEDVAPIVGINLYPYKYGRPIQLVIATDERVALYPVYDKTAKKDFYGNDLSSAWRLGYEH